MTNELSDYIQRCYDYEHEQKFEDVYITDHVPIDKKSLSESKSEEQEFYNYQKSIDEYNADTTQATV
jgi:hypothetical protein